MNTSRFNARIISVYDAHKKTSQLIQRLSKLPASDTHDARVELSAEIHQNLNEQEEDFELLRQEFEDHADWENWAVRRRGSEIDRERTAFAAHITRLGEDLRSARSQFRRAQLHAKRNAEAAKRKERELLFESIREGTGPVGSFGRRKGGQEKLSQDELLLNATNDVTAALRETHSLMQVEVSRSQFAHETLRKNPVPTFDLVLFQKAKLTCKEQSTAALSILSENYGSLDSLLSSSRSLISSLLYSQKSDTWYLESAFYILVCTIAWLFFRRIIYGPAWWLVYQPTKLIFQLSIYLLQLFLGTLTALTNATGGGSASQSRSTLSTSTSLIVQPSAKGGFPKFHPSMSAPNIAAGGGGAGAKEQPLNPRNTKTTENTISGEIEKMAENSGDLSAGSRGESATNDVEAVGQQQSTILRERREDELPNPKKRMWEEPLQKKETVHDEL